MFVVVLFVASRGQVAKRFREGNRFYYFVPDFALTDPSDYTSTRIPSPCEYGLRNVQGVLFRKTSLEGLIGGFFESLTVGILEDFAGDLLKGLARKIPGRP